MAVIANAEAARKCREAAELFLDAMTDQVETLVGPAVDAKERAATVGAFSSTVLLDVLATRFGAFPAWSGLGQGIGSALAQLPSDGERLSAQVILAESVKVGHADAATSFAPSSPLRQ